MTDHVHSWARPKSMVWPNPLRCSCGAVEHPRSCYDDDGKLECACGLEQLQDASADYADGR